MMTLDKWDKSSNAIPGEIIDELKALFDAPKFPRLWLFHGGNGRGKTYMAGLFADEIRERVRKLESNRVLPLYSYDNFMVVKDRAFRDELIRMEKRNKSEWFEDQLQQARQTRLLVIDEFGRAATEYGFSLWLDILDSRPERITIIVSNYSADELGKIEERVTGNQAIRSRLYQARILAFGGDDYRKTLRDKPPERTPDILDHLTEEAKNAEERKKLNGKTNDVDWDDPNAPLPF